MMREVLSDEYRVLSKPNNPLSTHHSSLITKHYGQ